MTLDSCVTTVFVHGFLDDGAVWDRVRVARARQTPTVVAELAGMAGRPDAPGPYTLARHVSDVLALVDATAGPVLLVGQSLGAQVVELVAARRPDRVAGMVLVTPVPLAGTRLPADAIAPFTTLGGDGDAQRAVREQLSVAFPADELDRLAAAGRRITAEAAAGTVDTWNGGDPAGDEPSAVTAPVVVLGGRHDPFVTAEVLEGAVATRFADVTVAGVDGAGHWPHLERPDVVAGALDDLVGRLVEPGPGGTAGTATGQGWTSAFASRSATAFDDTFAPEVVLRASVLRAPIEGRDDVAAVMGAASGIYTALTFTHEARQGDRTYLEWDAALHDGTEVSGVTRLVADEHGRTTEIAIHHRPLDGALRFSDELGRRLEGRIERDRFHRS
jgi:pimeloyl-ACP methyl ester carboxylesterase